MPKDTKYYKLKLDEVKDTNCIINTYVINVLKLDKVIYSIIKI